MKLLNFFYFFLLFGTSMICAAAEDNTGKNIIVASQSLLSDSLFSKREKDELEKFVKLSNELPLSSMWDCETTFDLAADLAEKLSLVKTPGDALQVTFDFLDAARWSPEELVVRRAAYDLFAKVAKLTTSSSQTRDTLRLLKGRTLDTCLEVKNSLLLRNKKLKAKVQELRRRLAAEGPNAFPADFAYQQLEFDLDSRARFMSSISKQDNEKLGTLAPFIYQSRLNEALENALKATTEKTQPHVNSGLRNAPTHNGQNPK